MCCPLWAPLRPRRTSRSPQVTSNFALPSDLAGLQGLLRSRRITGSPPTELRAPLRLQGLPCHVELRVPSRPRRTSRSPHVTSNFALPSDHAGLQGLLSHVELHAPLRPRRFNSIGHVQLRAPLRPRRTSRSPQVASNFALPSDHAGLQGLLRSRQTSRSTPTTPDFKVSGRQTSRSPPTSRTSRSPQVTSNALPSDHAGLQDSSTVKLRAPHHAGLQGTSTVSRSPPVTSNLALPSDHAGLRTSRKNILSKCKTIKKKYPLEM